MVELELDTLHADGEHLILRGPGGERYRLVIDESLRSAVRRDRPRLEALRAHETSTLRPRDIQARIRAGASVQEVADEGGLPLESVRRYEGPVQAERSWIAEQTRALPIGREVGAPTLGDLVVDRLAARGVSQEAAWDAVRSPGEAWEVTVAFEAGGALRVARWQVDLTTRSLVALDDESRWLSETELTGSRRPAQRRPFDVEHEGDGRRAPDVVILDSRDLDGERAPRDSEGADGNRTAEAAHSDAPAEAAEETDVDEAPATAPDEDSPAATEALLDRLDATRGRRGLRRRTRQEPGGDSDPADEADRTDDAPAAASGAGGTSSRSGVVDDALFPVAPVLRFRQQAEDESAQPAGADDAPGTEDTDDATGAEAAPAPRAPARGRGRGRRTSIPSWDEIVFGAKQD
ncbi:septation protein SepH [Litorihabitans aurantiacus]|uniref:DUF3071 domain-containing protein n=1 Tax=Litorihabitans aurantiacus TaxID=1930061 RepID=A0AA37XDZ8_9MICO|nr:septation protein SepH [Litorihabitans aurantiacus]GMA31454.1 hypothetical protein GCM10025875_14460 [Litorihabitans aurantiacus]